VKGGDNITYILGFFDTLIIIVCGIVIHYFRFGDLDMRGEYFLFLLLFAFLSLNIFSWFSLYRAWRGNLIIKELGALTVAFILIALCITALTFLTKSSESFSRLWVGWTFVTAYLSISCYRIIMRLFLRRIRSSGKNLKHVAIVGAGVLGKRACGAMLFQSWAGFKPIAFFDDDENLIGQTYKDIPVIGNINNVTDFIEAHRRWEGINRSPIDQVWIALPIRDQERIEELQKELQNTATNVFFIPDLYGFNLANYKVEEKIGLPIMNMSASPMEGNNALMKRLEDFIISSILLILLSPFFFIIALLVKLESSGPVFFKQRRYGVDGKEISVWKFRSMKVIEDGEEVKQAQRSDPRVTKFGGFLRKSSLDELPQLINVIQGTMSLVGPRPHAVAHNEFYRDKVQGYMERHKMRPGITGWAQVNGCRGETAEISQMEERVRYDLEYIRNWSIALDFRILFRTFSTVLNTKNTY